MELDLREWLETDGRGGYAMGTVSGVRTRRYHALLVAATRPPAGRMVLVNGLETFVETARGRFALTSHRYRGDVIHPDGAARLVSFEAEPWPTWTWRLEGDHRVSQELFIARGTPRVFLRWRLLDEAPAGRLWVRPLLSGRDHHALQRENPVFRFGHEPRGEAVRWSPYPGVPSIDAVSNGAYRPEPDWYRAFFYSEEAARGLDAVEDLASPGAFTFDLARGPAVLLFGAGEPEIAGAEGASAALAAAEEAERSTRRRFASPLARAAEAYRVARGGGRSVIAGYPWFTDWGRDTFVALRGLCLAAGRHAEARDVVATWAEALSAGMLPNRFPERGDEPAYNSVDATLWFVLAVGEVLRHPEVLSEGERRRLEGSVLAVVERYGSGTRFGIRCDADGLLACGEPGTQLTWMDASVERRPVTPRVGKPVEIQALWVNALAVAAALAPRWGAAMATARAAFAERFWDDSRGWLADVVDCDHVRGAVDGSLRPNQIFAAGALPVALVDPPTARRVVAVVEERLWTPMGLRTLAPGAPGYAGRYEGDAARRDSAYHQGTAWPWLTAPFVDAWLRAHGGGAEAREEARQRFLDPLRSWALTRGFGHLPEIADGDPPHAARGCPFQAWSVAAALQMERALEAP
jgi:predicted glycogen debranching enzyme